MQSACFFKLFLQIPVILFLLCSAHAFGITHNGRKYTVVTGGGLVFSVDSSNGDITSLLYNNVEYQEKKKQSQLNSGLHHANVSASANADIIKITVKTTGLTHYYMARKGYNHIYMATRFSEHPPDGMLRYIVRILSRLLPNGPVPSDIRNNVRDIEAHDIVRMSNGETRSKHYSNRRLIDWSYTGATGKNVGVFMVRSNKEGGSGGPFYRSLQNQCDKDQELYEVILYGEGQTESFVRYGTLNGPYTLVFTDGSQPTLPIDTSWISTLGLPGYVPQAHRGLVTGKVNGIPKGFEGVVGFANKQAQYWCKVSHSRYKSPWMIPGTYVQTLYKEELEVATQIVTVGAGTSPVVKDITSAEPSHTYIWRIGQWDGTPSGFLNADKVTFMHPSDVRMEKWEPVTYVVGRSADNFFPSYQWSDMNDPTTIEFELSWTQMRDHTLRIGITTAFHKGRPKVLVNSWTSPSPAYSNQPNTRSLTIGTYRGNNFIFEYKIPATAFVVGTNIMKISIIGGSGSGGPYLTPGVAFDCVELDV